VKLLERNALVASPPNDRTQFAFLVREFVSCFYPGTEATYGLQLFDQHLAGIGRGADSQRLVWSIRAGNESVGFLVATRRLDRSVKVGPVVVEPGHRAEGHISGALQEIAAFYRDHRTPYLYATYPRSNARIGDVAERAGWEIAGAVRGLYRDDEEVLIHQALSDKPTPVAQFGSLRRASPFVVKRGGSVLLRVSELDSYHDIELAGRGAAAAVRPMNRICFSRVNDHVASSIEVDEALPLIDGTKLVVWR
jgi:hypothetical protein